MQDETIVSEAGNSGTIAALNPFRQSHFPALAPLARNIVYHGISSTLLERVVAVLPPGPEPGEPAITVPMRLTSCFESHCRSNQVTDSTDTSNPARERAPVLCGLSGLRCGGLIHLSSLRF